MKFCITPFCLTFSHLTILHQDGLTKTKLVSYDLRVNKSTPTCQGNGLVLGLVTVMLCFDLQIVILTLHLTVTQYKSQVPVQHCFPRMVILFWYQTWGSLCTE